MPVKKKQRYEGVLFSRSVLLRALDHFRELVVWEEHEVCRDYVSIERNGVTFSGGSLDEFLDAYSVGEDASIARGSVSKIMLAVVSKFDGTISTTVSLDVDSLATANEVFAILDAEASVTPSADVHPSIKLSVAHQNKPSECERDAAEGKILIIHGHDEVNVLRLKDMCVHRLGLPEPIVMSQKVVPGATLPEKFERLAKEVDFAFALFTPDDLAKAQAEEEFHPRARQNVVLEFGWFWGRLGREHVFLLYKGNVEMPSDLQGIEYHRFVDSPLERIEQVRDFLKHHGVRVK